MQIPIGVANSISANFNFDPRDTCQFATLKHFDLVQIYLNEHQLTDRELQKDLVALQDNFQFLYFHTISHFEPEFFNTTYFKQLEEFLQGFRRAALVIHFSETASVDSLMSLAQDGLPGRMPFYIENIFSGTGTEAAEKNIKKYMAIFTLLHSYTNRIRAALDIPRLFHQNTRWTPQEALNWCYMLMNFFTQNRIPLLLHVVNYTTSSQQRHEFCALDAGYIPYPDIFAFIQKTRPAIEGIILEFEDKINTLRSRDNIRKWLAP